MSVGAYPAYRESGSQWLGLIPAGWDMKPIWAVASCNDEILEETTSPDYVMLYVEISDVDAVSGISGATELAFAAAPSRARRRVADGDVIVSTVRTYLRAIAPIVAPPANTIVSTGFAVLRPRKILPAYLAYLLRAEFTVAEIIARSTGVSYPAINARASRHLGDSQIT